MNAKHIYPCPVQANCANVTTGCWGECYLQKQQRERAGSVFTTGAPPEQESAGQDNRNVGGPKGDTADPALADPEPGGVEPDCIKCMRDRPDLYGEELAYIDSLTARLREMEKERDRAEQAHMDCHASYQAAKQRAEQAERDREALRKELLRLRDVVSDVDAEIIDAALSAREGGK
jgi:chromosome segregation ATPase